MAPVVSMAPVISTRRGVRTLAGLMAVAMIVAAPGCSTKAADTNSAGGTTSVADEPDLKIREGSNTYYGTEAIDSLMYLG